MGTAWRRLATHLPAIRQAAEHYGLRWSLVAAIVCQESGARVYAIRPEPSFWRRYQAGIRALVRRTANRYDDRWAQYPDLASASYGLLQVLYVVALERGAVMEFPTDLLDPAMNLDIGCRHLAWCIAARGGNERAGLLRYNGGGDRTYPDKVLEWERQIVALGNELAEAV
jgi:soluble lytic murein transglycosylase-like protein